MAIQGVDTKCYILALFVRDDGERFLLGSGHYEFKDTQMHFAANAIQNDIVEVQGNDGFLLAGQVRRPGTQSFDGYVGDGTMSKEETESYRRQFFSFFRKNFFYKVIYVFSDGTAIQRKSGFLVDDPTVEELYQMYPEYHVALNFEDVNYYSYSEDEEGQEQYAKEATIDTSSMRATGGLVWDNIGVVWEDTQWGGEQTASGTEITVQNEMNVSSIVDDIRLYGNTEQQTYSGKNLLNLPDTVHTENQIRWTVSNSIHAVGQGTTASNAVSYLNTATTINFDITGNFTFSISQAITAPLYIRFYSSSNANLGQIAISTGDTSKTGTIPSGAVSYRILLAPTPNTTYDIDIYLQLEKSSQPSAIEPYVGGIPSPNPDYPQEVQTVTGEQTVSVTGKNLYYLDTAPHFSSNAAYIDVVYGVNDITIEAVGTGGAQYAGAVTTELDPTKTYTLSGTATKIAETSNTRVAYWTSDDGSTWNLTPTIAFTETLSAGQTYDFSFQVTGSKYYRFGFYNANTATVTLGTKTKYSNIQLEAGSTASDFTPYRTPQSYLISIGSTELCMISDYQDYIYKSGDDWYLHKEIGKVVFNGTETWGQVNSYAYFSTTINSDLIKPLNIYSLPLILSNYYSPASRSNLYDSTVDYGIGIHENTPNRILIRNKDYTSIPAFTTWLSNHNTTVYYPLATPTDTIITDNTLIGQLNALGAMRLFIGENNLAIQATGTNLPAPLSFKYYTTVAMTGAVWEEGGSGGATVVEVDSITNTYPIWRVKGPAVNPQLSVINTNTTIRYTGTVTSTQTLEIDMFNKTAKLNGVSVIGNVSGDWVSLAPGTNRVIYTAENADAQPSTIEWQEVVG